MNKNTVLALVLISIASFSLFAVHIVKADSKIILVPDDYTTITQAIGNATNGDTILIRKGTYEGPINKTIVIDKTLTVIGENAENTIIKLYPAYNVTWILTQPFFSYSDAIAITADDCRIFNLTLVVSNPGGFITAMGNGMQLSNVKITTGSSTGIKVNGSNCRITDNIMSGLIQLNGTFNEVSSNSLYSIYVYGSSNLIKDNSCQNLGLSNSTDNVVLGNRITTDSRSYSGIDLHWSNNNFFCKNHVSGFSSGFRLWYSPGNTIAANNIADSLHASISFGASSNNRIYLNNLIENPFNFTPYVYDDFVDPNYHAAFPDMTLSTNYWDNGTIGNHWGSYNGSDVNGDGTGDAPYIINSNNQDNFPLIARVDIDSIRVELPEWVNRLPVPSSSPPLFPSVFPTPSFSLSPSPSPSSSPTLSPSPSQIKTPTLTPAQSTIPSISPSENPTGTPKQIPRGLGSYDFVVEVTLVVFVAVMFVVAFAFVRKHKPKSLE